jgi:hypothetical protein
VLVVVELGVDPEICTAANRGDELFVAAPDALAVAVEG